MKRRKNVNVLLVIITLLNIAVSVMSVINDRLMNGYIFLVLAFIFAIFLYISGEKDDNRRM